MKRVARVAHSFRVLSMVFHRRELSLGARNSVTLAQRKKSVASKQRDRDAERVPYPEERLRAA